MSNVFMEQKRQYNDHMNILNSSEAVHTVLLPGLAGFKLAKSTFTASGFCSKLVALAASLT